VSEELPPLIDISQLLLDQRSVDAGHFGMEILPPLLAGDPIGLAIVVLHLIDAAAGEAAKAGDRAEGLRLVGACEVVPPPALGGLVVVATVCVGTKGRGVHESASLK